jgi:dolichol-phosphate mannosyltransferase
VSELFVFFPVYDEGSSAAALVERLDAACTRLGRPFRLLAVDDGSTDGSGARLAALARERPLTLLSHEGNRGLAAALSTGIAWLCREAGDGDVVVMMDGDDTHDPACLPGMLAALDAGAELVVASRFRAGAEIRGVPFSRQLLSRAASRLGRLRFRVPGLTDYSSGYRAVRARALKAAAPLFLERAPALERRGFACALELLLLLAEAARGVAGVPAVTEVPIVLRYDRKQCPSSMSALRTVLGTLALLAARRPASTRSWR